MPERVTFTRKSAERISNVVKRVEKMPAAEPIQQRRRAGGYRMESLWEVTEVNTTDEVVTLKRVQDTDDNLNDPSETENVAYDPDDQPSVGSRGLIIRLGDGTRFFFRPQKGIRHHATEAAMVKDTAPNSTFDYNADQQTIYRDEDVEQRIVYKFATPIAKALGPHNLGDICLGESSAISGVGVRAFAAKNVGDSEISIGFGIHVRFITEDFDCSAVTWNSLLGLSSLGHTNHFKMETVRVRAGEWTSVAMGADTPPNLLMMSAGTIDINVPIYGMYARFDHWPSDTELTAIVKGYVSNPVGHAFDSNRVWLDVEFSD